VYLLLDVMESFLVSTCIEKVVVIISEAALARGAKSLDGLHKVVAAHSVGPASLIAAFSISTSLEVDLMMRLPFINVAHRSLTLRGVVLLRIVKGPTTTRCTRELGRTLLFELLVKVVRETYESLGLFKLVQRGCTTGSCILR
jgi:hypothetical protein